MTFDMSLLYPRSSKISDGNLTCKDCDRDVESNESPSETGDRNATRICNFCNNCADGGMKNLHDRQHDVDRSRFPPGADETKGLFSLDRFVKKSFTSKLKLFLCIKAWFTLNAAYNIQNKKTLIVVPFPLTVGCSQLGIGSVCVFFFWSTGIRDRPTIRSSRIFDITKIGVYHCVGQLLCQLSYFVGTVSFAIIVKSFEPFFAAIISGLMIGQWMKAQVYLALIPVVAGAGFACLEDVSFSKTSFFTAMLSNIFSSLLVVCSKLLLSVDNKGKNMNAVNIFGLITLCAFAVSVPIVILSEGPLLIKFIIEISSQAEVSKSELAVKILSSGLLHYLNNEFLYRTLEQLHPVTLSVTNTLKRIAVIMAVVVAFDEPFSPLTAFGFLVGSLGAILYALTKWYYEDSPARYLNEEKESSGSLSKFNETDKLIQRKTTRSCIS